MADLTREEAQALLVQMSNADLQAELGDRGLAKTGNKDELVARLLDAEFPPPGDGDGPVENPAPADPDPEVPAEGDELVEDGELCLVCWPAGWPTPDTNNASCEHGVWDR